jgi:hypothetical protein
MNAPLRSDLVVLATDTNMQFALRGILSRYQALRIRQLTQDIFVHTERDPGCLLHAQDFLRPLVNRYRYALVVFDHDGCGKEGLSRQELETDVERRLSENGWGDRAAAIIIDPELENWVWSDSPHVATILGWQDRTPDLRSWLKAESYLSVDTVKPRNPKSVMEEALRRSKKPRSSSLYHQLALKVGFERCIDPAFRKLKTTLQTWFSTANASA